MAKSESLRGEILPPLPRGMEVARPVEARTSPAQSLGTSNQDLNLIATWLDDRFEIPRLGVRFGLDALIGWIPGIGDAIAAAASLFIVAAAWKRGAKRITLLRMSLNLTVENMLGAIPIVGDLAHIAWKANRRNYNLLMRDQQSAREHTWQDWLFVIGVLCLIGVLFLIPILLLVYLLRHPPHWLLGR
jgi:hypothetical protein